MKIHFIEIFVGLSLTFGLGQLDGFNNETLQNINTISVSRRTHQITTILDRLLENYDPNIRPNFEGSKSMNFLK